MAEVNVGDVLRLGATWTFEGVFEVTNVWHVVVTGGADVSYAVASLDVQDYLEDIYTEILPLLSIQMDTDFISLANMTQDTTFGAIAWGNPLVGTSGGQVTAPGVCLFSWARTLKARVQIRKYFGVSTEDNVTNGLWAAGARVDALDAMSLHILDWIDGAEITLQGVAYNRLAQTHTFAISAAVREEPAYQRRRKRGRGS